MPGSPADLDRERLSEVRRWAQTTDPDLVPIAEVAAGTIATVAGIVDRVRISPREGGVSVHVRDATGEIRASWRGREAADVLPGRGVLLRGRVRRTPRLETLEMRSPRLLVMSETP